MKREEKNEENDTIARVAIGIKRYVERSAPVRNGDMFGYIGAIMSSHARRAWFVEKQNLKQVVKYMVSTLRINEWASLLRKGCVKSETLSRCREDGGLET